MACITNNRKSHKLILVVTRKQFFEPDRETLELWLGGKTWLQQFGFQLYLVLKVGQWGPIEVASVILRRNCSACFVVVGSTVPVEGPSLRHVLLLPSLFFFSKISVYRHHILKVVTTWSEIRPLSNSSKVGFFVSTPLIREESLARMMVKTTRDLPFETLRRVSGIALTVEVFWVDARDEACVAWYALVPYLVCRSVHPRAGGLAHIPSHGHFLWAFIWAIYRGRAHLRCYLLLPDNARAGINHTLIVCEAEIVASLSVALSSRVAHDVNPKRNVACVAWNFLSALHL